MIVDIECIFATPHNIENFSIMIDMDEFGFVDIKLRGLFRHVTFVHVKQKFYNIQSSSVQQESEGNSFSVSSCKTTVSVYHFHYTKNANRSMENKYQETSSKDNNRRQNDKE